MILEIKSIVAVFSSPCPPAPNPSYPLFSLNVFLPNLGVVFPLQTWCDGSLQPSSQFLCSVILSQIHKHLNNNS